VVLAPVTVTVVFEILKVGRLPTAGGIKISEISAFAPEVKLMSEGEMASVTLNNELAPETTKVGVTKLTTVALVLELSC
jgi:hypothetical protein